MSALLPFAFLSGIGPGEILLIFIVTLALFGPKRLPEMARMLGRTLTALRRASQDIHDQVMHMDEPSPGARGPLKPPPTPLSVPARATPPPAEKPVEGPEAPAPGQAGSDGTASGTGTAESGKHDLAG